MTSSILLHSILEEINKNVELGIRESHLPITQELLDSILASFSSDPTLEEFLLQVNDVLRVQLVEQDMLLGEIDTFISEYAKQISPDPNNTNNIPTNTPVLMHNIPSPSSLPILDHHSIILQQPPNLSSPNMLLSGTQKKKAKFCKRSNKYSYEMAYRSSRSSLPLRTRKG